MTMPSPARAVLIGYATLDYVATTAAPLRGHGTVSARLYSRTNWPRAGGAVLYAGARLATAGHFTAPLIQLGDDPAGNAYIKACEDADIAIDGIVRVAGSQSPQCLLIYHDSGGYSCLLDFGDLAETSLTRTQMALAASADLIVVSAGTPAIAEAVLKAARPHQIVAWIAKDDPTCFPPHLCAALSARADFIFHNKSERVLISPGPIGQIRVETQGADGATVTTQAGVVTLPISPIDVEDATGAGDTLAGETLAQWLSGPRDPIVAVTRGMQAAYSLLASRKGGPA